MSVPISLLAVQKVKSLLTEGEALSQAVTALGQAFNLRLPPLRTGNIFISSMSAELGDRNAQMTYPRICLATFSLQNLQIEKFCAFSGVANITAEIFSSGDRLEDSDSWIHYYVEAFTSILREGIGDWGDGVFFGGAYECQMLPPKPGGLGFAQAAKVSFDLQISRD